jgi:hypothetical protein
LAGILRGFRSVLNARSIPLWVLLLPVSDHESSANDAALARLCAKEALKCIDMTGRSARLQRIIPMRRATCTSELGVEMVSAELARNIEDSL